MRLTTVGAIDVAPPRSNALLASERPFDALVSTCRSQLRREHATPRVSHRRLLRELRRQRITLRARASSVMQGQRNLERFAVFRLTWWSSHLGITPA